MNERFEAENVQMAEIFINFADLLIIKLYPHGNFVLVLQVSWLRVSSE